MSNRNRIITPEQFAFEGAKIARRIAKQHGIAPDKFAAACLTSFGFSPTAAKRAVAKTKRKRPA